MSIVHRFLRFAILRRALGSACPSRFWPGLYAGPGVLLILTFSAGQIMAGEQCLQDTITIDGAPLELELAVSQAPKPFEDTGGKVRNLSRQRPTVLLGLGSGFSWHANSALGPHVSRFIGKGTRPAATMHAGLEWSAKRRFFRCDAAFSAWNSWSYDAAFLNDSLYQLQADGQGGLEQLIRFTYPDLGLELDTLSLPTSTYAMQSVSFGLAFGGEIGKGSTGRKLPCRWWLGATGRMTQSNRENSAINRVGESALPSPSNVLGEARNDWEPTELWSMGIKLGASVPFGRQGWEGTVNGFYSGGVAPLLGLNMGVQKRWVNRR